MRAALLSLLLLAVAGNAATAVADDSGFAGYWDGSIALPGMKLGIRVHLAQDDSGAWTGTIDIPMQGAKDLPLEAITASGDSITFAIAAVPGTPTFNGVRDGDSIRGPFSQSGQTFDFELTRGAGEAPRRPQDPEPPFPYSSRDVTFQSGGVTLAGTVTVPEGDGPFPAVVLLTGSGPQNRNEEVFDHRPFLVIADYLSRRGIAVLRYDDRGVGGSSGSQTEATSADFAGDALAAVALLEADGQVDRERIGLLGHSEGGMTGPMAAAESDAVAFLVLLAPPGVPAPELIARQAERIAIAEGQDEETVAKIVELNRELTGIISTDADDETRRAGVRDIIARQFDLSPPDERPSGEVREKLIQGGLDQAFSPWFQFFIRYDPRVTLRKVTVPVLALFGALDTQVDADQNRPALEEALAEAGNSDVTVRTMPGLNHMFQHATTGGVAEYTEIDETISPEVLEIVYRWIAARFLADAPE
jgi:pimeloyl-ACP methyl ester carboxylesterase